MLCRCTVPPKLQVQPLASSLLLAQDYIAGRLPSLEQGVLPELLAAPESEADPREEARPLCRGEACRGRDEMTPMVAVAMDHCHM